MPSNDFTLLEVQQNIHEMIAQQQPLRATLVAITDWISLIMPGALVSIMRFDPGTNTLSMVPSTQFSQGYVDQMQNIPIGPDQGTCGTAAYSRELVITDNIQSDSKWEGYHHLAETERVRACWSMPILTADGELLGTFATYYRSAASPTDGAQKNLSRGAALVALAILRHRDNEDHIALSEWYRTLFENHPDGVYTFDLEGRFVSGNAALERITGYSVAELIGVHFNEFIQPSAQELTQTNFDRALRGEPVTYETAGIHADGRPYYLEIINFPVSIKGEIVGVYGICRDVTERKAQEAELHQLQRGIEASPHGVLMADAQQPDHPVVYVNPAFCEITGYPREEVLGQNCRFLQGSDTDPEAIKAVRRGLEQRTDIDVTLLNYRKDGTPFWNHLLIRPVLNTYGECTHFIGIQQDITPQKEQEAKIRFQATHDLLTGLPNQAAFTETLEELIRHSAQTDSLAVLYLDLDGFKPINEGLGHPVGNRILQVVAQRLQAVMPEQATIARLVGDEFGIALPDRPDRSAIIELAQRILLSLGEPIEVDQQLVHISASIGIATNGDEVVQPHQLLQFADVALGRAKRQGRNTWQWYGAGKAERLRHNVSLRHDMHTALKENQFELYYQPLVDAVTGRMRSVEALVRWHHPSRGLVSPADFIPLAEQTGQIVPLGLWILRQACQEMAAFNAERERGLRVAVNISSLQFIRDGFLDDVFRVLDDTGLSPQLLELEVTESVLIDGAEHVIELMETLKDHGIRVALDDFGTGFSSLSYLRDLPTHKVKLDRSFVQNTATDRRIAAIVQGVITMAHHMDMMVVAEGIETREQQEDLARRHCDILQGYLFARPMPLAELRLLPEILPADSNE